MAATATCTHCGARFKFDPRKGRWVPMDPSTTAVCPGHPGRGPRPTHDIQKDL